jgi:hypothetical protein
MAVLSLVDVSRAGPDNYDVIYATDTSRSRREDNGFCSG